MGVNGRTGVGKHLIFCLGTKPYLKMEPQKTKAQ